MSTRCCGPRKKTRHRRRMVSLVNNNVSNKRHSRYTFITTGLFRRPNLFFCRKHDGKPLLPICLLVEDVWGCRGRN